jgi:hypothetical protein
VYRCDRSASGMAIRDPLCRRCLARCRRASLLFLRSRRRETGGGRVLGNAHPHDGLVRKLAVGPAGRSRARLGVPTRRDRLWPPCWAPSRHQLRRGRALWFISHAGLNYPGRAGMTRPGRPRKCHHLMNSREFRRHQLSAAYADDRLHRFVAAYLEMRPEGSAPFSVLVSRPTSRTRPR